MQRKRARHRDGVLRTAPRELDAHFGIDALVAQLDGDDLELQVTLLEGAPRIEPAREAGSAAAALGGDWFERERTGCGARLFGRRCERLKRGVLGQPGPGWELVVGSFEPSDQFDQAIGNLLAGAFALPPGAGLELRESGLQSVLQPLARITGKRDVLSQGAEAAHEQRNTGIDRSKHANILAAQRENHFAPSRRSRSPTGAR